MNLPRKLLPRKITPVANWRGVLRYSWSIRFIIIAGFFAGLEMALPVIDGIIPVPPRVFAVLSFVATMGAVVSRLVAQEKLGGRYGDS